MGSVRPDYDTFGDLLGKSEGIWRCGGGLWVIERGMDD